MELSTDVYDWLVSVGALTEYDAKDKQETHVTLEMEPSQQLETGLKFPEIVKRLYALKVMLAFLYEKRRLKETHTPSARLYNWNIIVKALATCGIDLGDDEKSLIVAGDTQILSDLLSQIKGLFELESGASAEIESETAKQKKSQQQFQPTGKRGKAKPKPSGIDITSLSASKEITKTESCLEFLLISLSRAFALQPKQAAGLLTDGSQYLAHILIKGLKGEYPPVESFLMEVYAASKHFTNLMKREEGGTTEMVLNMLKGGLYSKSKEVVTWTLKVLSKIAYDLSALELNKSAWEWFIAVDGGLDGAVYAMQKHAEVHNTAIEMMLNFGKQNIIELFTQFLKNVINDNGKYWKLVNTFIKPLSDQKGAGEEAFQKCIESVLSHWFDSAIRIAENDGRHSIQDRVVALSVLCEIWINSPTVAESKEDLAEKSLSVLRRATRDKSQALQFYVLAQLFNLLELFATEKKPYAPTLYKSLAFSFLEMHPQEDIREFILANLSALYTQMPAVPVSIVVEPLVRQVETSENVTYFFNLTDFDFLGLVAVHPKLSLKSGLQLLDMFARLTLNDPIFSIIALQNFVKIAERFATDPSVAEFITKFVTLALNTLHNNIKKYYKKRPANPKGKPVQRPKAVRELEALEKEERILAGSNAQKIVDTLVCIQALNHEEINSLIRDTVLELYEKIKSQFGKPYEPLKALLTAYGLPNEIIAEFEEKKRQEQLERERAEQEAIERERKQKEEEMEKKKAAEMEKPKSQKRSHSQQKADNQLALVPVEKQRSSSKQYQIVPYQPQTDLGQKALVDIERIKKVKEEREARKQQIEEQIKLRAEKEKKSLQQQVIRRHLELGFVSKSTKNLADHLLLQEGSLDREIVRAKTAAEIELTNLDEEEPGDKEAIELMMKKHRKLFRYLFGKYANTCYAHKAKVFDSLRNKSELITIAEFRKMLNDHKVDQSEVSREELIVLFRLVNTKHKRSDIQTLTFEGFVECFMQLAIYLHNKSHQSAACVPLVESINKLISQFEEATQKRGENTIMYINPEAAALFAEDQELLKELNAMIEKSPNYPLPEGFKKTQIKEIKYVHSLKTFPASEPVKISVELIDEILNKALGVHFIEPRAVYEYRTKVVPDTLKGRNSTINTSHFPTKYSEITRSKPKSIQLEQLEEPKRPRLDFTLPKPKVSVATRLVIAAMPKELHDIGLEVGAVVEELVKAVEEGKTSLRPKGGEIMNKAMKERQELLEEIAKAEKEKEEKRKQRQQQLKKVLEEKKRMKTKAEPTKEQAEKKSKEQWEKELEELRKRVEERAEKRKEEKQKQLEEIETKQREEKEKRLKELEPFVKKRKEELDKLLKDTEEKKRKEREEEDRKEEEFKAKREKEYKKLEEQRKADKEMRELLRQQREDLLKFLKESKVVQLFGRYNKQLKALFDFYTKLEDLEIDIDLEMKARTMPYKSFIKLANQLKLVPTLVTLEEVVMIYKLIMKEKSESIRSLTLDDFLESLVRVAIRGNVKLSKKGSFEETESKVKDSNQKSTMLFFDVKEITVETLEKLMKYIGLSIGGKKKELVNRLIELQHEGVKGSSLKQKGSLVPKHEAEPEEYTLNLEEDKKIESKHEETQMSGEFKESPQPEKEVKVEPPKKEAKQAKKPEKKK